MDKSGSCQTLEALDHRLQFHLIVGCRLDSTTDLYTLAAGQMAENDGPPSRSGISTTGTIRIEDHFCI